MDHIFLKILNMSIAASWFILAVILLRFVLKKAPKWMIVLLWGLAALRLTVPFSFESTWSMIPSAETISVSNLPSGNHRPLIETGFFTVDDTANDYLDQTYYEGVTVPVDSTEHVLYMLCILWLMGIAAMLLYVVGSFVRVHRSVAERIPYEGNIFLCDHVKSPFILGIVRPRIYLPSGMDEAAMEPVIDHEKAHLSRHDHWWKPLSFLVLTIHWFNPLCWISYVLLCRDIELACDEKVVRQMDLEGKKQYSTALLECSAGRRLITICPLAFGEVGVKERVKNVLNYKKPAFWIVILAIAACVAAVVCFATDPVHAPFPMDNLRLLSANTMDLREDPPRLSELNVSELDELKARLRDMQTGGKDNDLYGFTPFFSLYVSAKEVGEFTISGFDRDGVNVGLLYQDNYYRVKDEAFFRFLDQLCAGTQREEAEAAGLSGTSSLFLEDVRAKFPEYFDLGTFKGLEVYVWQMAENSYSFGLMQGTNQNKPNEELWSLKSATAEEMKLILSTYDIEDENIFVIPFQQPYSSYLLTEERAKDPAYINDIRTMLGLDANPVIETLIETICASPAQSSNPQDYIDAHPVEYQELLYHGSYTLLYCFSRFETGGETGLERHIMARACQEIADGWGEESLMFNLRADGQLSGQQWYDAFKQRALDLKEQYAEIELAEQKPASYLLLSMLGEI